MMPRRVVTSKPAPAVIKADLEDPHSLPSTSPKPAVWWRLVPEQIAWRES